MVKKLFKHEFVYYIRTLGIFIPLVLVVGLVAKIFRVIDNGEAVTEIAMAFSTLMLFAGAFALLMFCTVVSIVRFYKNMYSSEGYLTFTLPVTNPQHIFVKLSVSMIFSCICALTVIAAILIAFSGEVMTALFKQIGEAFASLTVYLPTYHMVLYAVELLVLFLLGVASTQLLYYACITIGQTAKKNRILMAVVAYFVYYVISQALSTVVTIVFTILGYSDAFAAIGEFIYMHPIAAAHIFLCGAMVFSALITALFYFITLKIMNKKLNLE